MTIHKVLGILFLCFLSFLPLRAQQITPVKGTKLKYKVWVNIAGTGRQEFFLRVLVLDYGQDFGNQRIEFDYETSHKIPIKGKIIMKPKAVAKGKWDERYFYVANGGDKIFSQETALWISRDLYNQLINNGYLKWGKKSNLQYNQKSEGTYPLILNDVATELPVHNLVWDKNSEYKMSILNDAHNPLIMSFDAEFSLRLMEVSE